MNDLEYLQSIIDENIHPDQKELDGSNPFVDLGKDGYWLNFIEPRFYFFDQGEYLGETVREAETSLKIIFP